MMKRIAFFLTTTLLGAALADAAPVPSTRTNAVAGLWQPYRITPRAGAQHIALDGEWQLGWRDTAVDASTELNTMTNWFAAQVPSTVQWALHRAGKCGHPYEHLNSKQYDWVDQKVWYYRRTVELPAKKGDGCVFLCFDGIDYFARVWLNGKLLGRHEGMFGGPDIEISKHAKFGAANELVVEVKAGNFGNKADWKPRGPEGPVIKPWVIAGGTGGEMFFPLGMWRGARIEIVPLGHMERPFLVTEAADEKAARLTLSAEVFAGTNSLQLQLHPWKNSQLVDGSRGWAGSQPSKSRFALRVELAEKGSGKIAFDQTFPLQTFAGRNFVKQSFTVAKPKLWWPNGMGEPNLYRAKLTLIREGNAEDAMEFDYGIRTIRTTPTPGPRTTDRWADWQFVVNGRPLFVKGMNWMPADILLDLPRERYRWLIGAAKAAGIQFFRIWGGGLLETEEFYDTCNELGVMVWQDFPIGNRDTPEWPQDVWEAQVMQTIFRLRNHPSLVLWCGGNEFNPYSLGNAATLGIFERCVADFDPTRPMRRTSPDGGSLHAYPDMDPTWYGKLYRLVPYIAETGMHNIPEPSGIHETVNTAELDKPLIEMFEKSFPKQHPELMHHFVEYDPNRVPRMLSRASHIDDMKAPSLAALAEGTQIGAGEFYQIFSEHVQANYPVTAGLMPWVFKRPWPVIAIMLVDGFGQPTAPYYFLKRTYEPTHVLVKLPELMWAKGEQVPLAVHVTHAPAAARKGLKASVEILDAGFASLWRKTQSVSLQPGPSVAALDFGNFTISDSLNDKFFFIVAELRADGGQLVSRSVYWPRCLSRMSDEAFRNKYRATPQPALAFDKGPWLKPQTASQPTSLTASLVGQMPLAADRSQLRVHVKNTGGKPAFNTRLDIEGTKRAFYATDNFFWLAPGEERELQVEVLWRDPGQHAQATLTVSAWNAEAKRLSIAK
ncbi:MAG: sugar-binding domain-containing protein [Verrucomicrobiia bacterium]|jgi:beta-mannosidase